MTLDKVAQTLKNDPARITLAYAFNSTGKTQLCVAYKNATKQEDGSHTGVYYNAYSEDLFVWDNDEENIRLTVLPSSLSKFHASLTEDNIRDKLKAYKPMFGFALNLHADNTEKGIESISFFIPNQNPDLPQQRIKVSRGEERIFVWCFFLAVVQLALDGTEAYKWVKYIYIDDPVSSLDEHNAITVANNLAQLLKKEDSQIKTVVSTHHTLFFNVLCNELKRAKRYFLSQDKQLGGYVIRETGDTPFFHHVASLASLYEAEQSGKLFTHHFNMLRSILEKTASFHGYENFSACIKRDADDEDGILHTRLVNILSHGNYSLYEPQDMLEENKNYFRRILHDFITRYPFNPALFPSAPKLAAGSTL